MVVCVAVFCILGGGIGVVKLYRSHSAALSNFLPKQKVKAKAQCIKHDEVCIEMIMI